MDEFIGNVYEMTVLEGNEFGYKYLLHGKYYFLPEWVRELDNG